MSGPKRDRLKELQNLLAEEMFRILKDGVTATDEDGNIVKLTPQAPTLQAIRQFLKDNDVVVPPIDDNNLNPSLVKGLRAMVAQADDEDDTQVRL